MQFIHLHVRLPSYVEKNLLVALALLIVEWQVRLLFAVTYRDYVCGLENQRHSHV